MTEDVKKMEGKLWRKILVVAGVTAALLLLAFVLKRLIGSPEWTAMDFAVVAVMFFGTGLAYVLITHKRKEALYRLAVALASATGLLLFWTNLAVGIIGSEDEPANLMYFGVLAVAFVGSVVSRFQPRGLARAMWVTAGAQVLTIVIALLAGWQHLAESSLTEIIGINCFFAMLWAISGLLFRWVKQENTPPMP
ncbi:MAG: hypothetical protein OP8BY_1109 [Candidatus Saccharicenans subterraneus]|uniref:Uncharacterized protein n=1 Tax=Candidatus Saccharicenans subterraneus TaxID=2508984 RepID=A0A3E2BJS0_9BACT|nr:MAG: hypothetical protein OP8BY_1109 [Candidatus Saccharicenans subterraneum]